MLEYLVLTLSMLATGHVGVSTIFGHSSWDRSNPHSRLACYHRDISDRDLIIAHNTLPCGTRVWLYSPRTGLSTTAVVGDRGPRHAYADLSREVARRLQHNGKEPILLVPLLHQTRDSREALRSLVEGDPDRPLPSYAVESTLEELAPTGPPADVRRP